MEFQTSNNYCPDFSDICNDDCDFWDFLTLNGERKDIARKDKGVITECNHVTDSVGSYDESTKRNFSGKTLPIQTNVQQISNTSTDTSKHRKLNVTDFQILSSQENKIEKSEDDDDEFWDFLKLKTSNKDETPREISLSEELEDLRRLPSAQSNSQVPFSRSTETSSLKTLIKRNSKADKDLQNQVRVSEDVYRDLELLSAVCSPSTKKEEKRKAYQNISLNEKKMPATRTQNSAQKQNSEALNESSACLTGKCKEHEIKIKTQKMRAKILPSCNARTLGFLDQKFNKVNRNPFFPQNFVKKSFIGDKVREDNITSTRQQVTAVPLAFSSPCVKLEEILSKNNLIKMNSNLNKSTQITQLNILSGSQKQSQNIQRQLNPQVTLSEKGENNMNFDIPIISSTFSISTDTYDQSKFTSDSCSNIHINKLGVNNIEENYKIANDNLMTLQNEVSSNVNSSIDSNPVSSSSLFQNLSNCTSPLKQKKCKRLLEESPQNSVFKITDFAVASDTQNNGDGEILNEELTNKRQKIGELIKNVVGINQKSSDNENYPQQTFVITSTNAAPFHSIIPKISQPDQNQNAELVMVLNNENIIVSNPNIKLAPSSTTCSTTPFSAAPTVMNTHMLNSVYQTSNNFPQQISFPAVNVMNTVGNSHLPEKLKNVKSTAISKSALHTATKNTVKPPIPVSTAHPVRKINIIPSLTVQNPVQSNIIIYSIPTAPSNICPSSSQVNDPAISFLPSSIQIYNANSEGNKQYFNQIPGYVTLNASQLKPSEKSRSSDLFPVQIIKQTKQQKIRPIKNIPLGKDKKAIQQIKIPVKVADTTNSAVKCSNNNFIISENHYYQSSKMPSKPEQETIKKVPNADHTAVYLGAPQGNKTFNFIPHTRNGDPMQFKEHTIYNEAEIMKKKQLLNVQASTPSIFSHGTSAFTVNSSAILSNQDTLSNQSNVRLANPLNTNFHAGIAIENNDTEVIKNEISNFKNQGSESQNNSLATLQELFPPPISMVPVCVMQTVQTISKPTVSKVVVLKNNNEMQLSSPLNQLRSSNKKTITVKPKKLGRKTVRELLQEKYQHIPKPQVTTKLLKPIYRLTHDGMLIPTDNPVTTDKSLDSRCSIKYPMNTVSNVNLTVNSNKRPNIMVLPSAMKLNQNNIFLDNNPKTNSKQDYLGEETKSDSCSNEIYELPSDFLFDKITSKDYRPRYYDMCELRIGSFRVEDDVDSCGKFRSKFKVLFTKNIFVYDFPVMKCNQVDLSNCFSWEQIVRIQVPFKTVVAMNMSNRHISIQVNNSPQVCAKDIRERNDSISGEEKQNSTVDSENWLTSIKSSSIHRIILRKRQADNLKTQLCQFDPKFLVLFSIGANSKSLSLDATPFEEDMTSVNLRKMWTKNKRNVIRRLPQWDCETVVEPLEVMDNDRLISSNHVCSCRISCRSLRCSCVKAAKSCSTGGAVCLCTNCDNPLNILESFGMNIDFSLSDSCLFQNIYQIPKLRSYLQRDIKLNCCNSVARVLDCIPGTILCPNTECNETLEFSWCRGIVCYPERNPRNHCSYCGQCCFSNGRHCPICNRCFIVTSKCPECPLCRENDFEIKQFDEDFDFLDDEFTDESLLEPSLARSYSKPEIIVLDGAHSNQKTEVMSPGNYVFNNKADETYTDQKFIKENFPGEDMKIESQESQSTVVTKYVFETKENSQELDGCDEKQCFAGKDDLNFKENYTKIQETLKSETSEENSNKDLEIFSEKDSLLTNDDKLLLKSYLTELEEGSKTKLALDGEIELIDTM